MRIGINALTSGIAGVKTYLVNLVEHLARIDKRNEYFIFTTPQKKELFAKLPQNFRIAVRSPILTSTLSRIVWEQEILPFILRKEKIDVLFSPANINPLILRVFDIPSVLVIHTNLPWLFPDEIPSKFKLYMLRRFMELSITVADKVIAVSQTARQELIKSARIPENKVRCIYHGGASSIFKPHVTSKFPDKYKRKYGIYRDYILCVASLVRYRNHVRLIEAYNTLKKSYSVSHQLVIIGKIIDNDYYQEILQTIQKYNLNDDVIVTSYIPYEDLPKFYGAASLYVFPSYCEVFGLTQIEAMACGVPVVTSNVSAMPEICDDAALYFNPFDAKDIVDVVLKVLNNPVLQKELIKEGFERVKYFSWEKTAKETLSVFEDVYRQAS